MQTSWERTLLSGFAVLLFGCSSGDSPTGGGGGGDVESAWTVFTAGDDAQARTLFADIVADDPRSGAAQLGLGWTTLTTASDVQGLGDAVDAFDAALANGASATDTHAGRAFALLALGSRHEDAVADVQAVFDAESDYAFSRRPSIGRVQLDLVLAASRFAAGDVDGALAACDAIEASRLDAADASSWRLEGVPFSTFEAAVAARIADVAGRIPR